MIRFGIIGLGKIADKFASDLKLVDGVSLYAVASRSLEKAQKFAFNYKAHNAYGNYDELLRDPEVDIIYIATPHHAHFKWTMASLNAGKHVLCEKPLGINGKQVSEMVALAESKNLFLMEALWSRFIPGFEKIPELIKKYDLGEIKRITAQFAFPVPQKINNRLTDPKLGGGALLDIGIYPIYLCYYLLGLPDAIKATARLENGIDRQVSITFQYTDCQAQLYCSFDHQLPRIAQIQGANGVIEMQEAFHECKEIHINPHREDVKKLVFKKKGLGYAHEIEEVRECINNRLHQSDKMSWQDSLNLINLLDKVRDLIGLQYDAD